MIGRRKFVFTGSAVGMVFALCPRAIGQSKKVRVGLLAAVSPTPPMLNALREGLREYGYVEGTNLSIDVRWPPGPFEQHPGVASEFARGEIDVIVAWSTPAVDAARRATSTIPIVMVGPSDPVGTGLISSLARPGGNITGITNIAPDLSAKTVQLLTEVVPGINRIGAIFNSKNPGSAALMPGTEVAVRALGLALEVVEARNAKEFERAFVSLSAGGAKAVVMLADPSFIEFASKIGELAQKTKLPTVFQRRENVEAGGLMSYGPSLNWQFRRAAYFVDRIVKGAAPADLPVEQPIKFELVINLKTAKALGITVPPTLLARADEVIE